MPSTGAAFVGAERRTVLIEDECISYLFQIIEGLSDDVNDPYHYPIIRVLVCSSSRIEILLLISAPAHS